MLLQFLLASAACLASPLQGSAAEGWLARAAQLSASHDYLPAEALLQRAVANLSSAGASLPLADALEALADAQGVLRRHAAAAESRARALSARLTLGGGSLSATELIMAYALAAKDLKGARAYGAALGSLARARAAGQRAGGVGPAVEASLLAMESELRDCTGEAGAALAAAEQAASLRGAPPSPEEQLHHLDLLRKALRAEDPEPPPAIAAALARRARALEAALLARGPWQHPQQLPRTHLPGLYGAPWHEHTGAGARWPALTAPAAAQLARAAPALRAEFTALQRAQRLLEETECVHTGGGGTWRWAATNGFWQERDAAGCAVDMPAACALVAALQASIPGLRVLRAGYSAIEGPTHLRPHCGWSNAQLKMHLGLRVPRRPDGSGEGCAMLRVGNETRTWARDSVLMFDDSWEHEVVHACAAQRVVFQLVFAHPDLAQGQGGAGLGAAQEAQV